MSQEGLNLQFDDTSIAFANKEDRSLKRASWQGAQVANGLTMLHAQAEASWRIWKVGE